MKVLMFSLCVAALLSTNACSIFKRKAVFKPAKFESYTKGSLTVLDSAADTLMPGANLHFYDNAFLRNSIYAFQRKHQIGRDLSLPIRFQLQVKGDACYLIQLNTQKEPAVLDGLACIKLKR
ncbi:MAG: hypothetical protein ACI93R_000998 [Flavobacteriales bacterium]|jgi:hypothetical protein